MKYVRVKSYHKDKFVAEHAYFGDNQSAALSRFRKEYPEHHECVLVAQTIDDEDDKWIEWFRAARDCGCVHYF